MTNEVKRSLGQKTRLFLDYCCFCGLLGQIRPRSLPFPKSLGRPDPLPRATPRAPPCAAFPGPSRRVGLVFEPLLWRRGPQCWGPVGPASGGPAKALAWPELPSGRCPGLLPREPRGLGLPAGRPTPQAGPPALPLRSHAHPGTTYRSGKLRKHLRPSATAGSRRIPTPSQASGRF